MQPYKTDVAVLMLFFNRPDKFGQVFEQVRQARPSQLFLYQDGPRGERDMLGIMACRKIAENIDWQCDVQRHYCEQNQGCDPSEYLSQKWAFSMVDKCIVLEDDDVPSQSFFPFCKEMLDRYADDNRVWLISGFNTDEVSPDVSDDYFFTSTFSIWGWASWRRVIDTWDGSYSFLDDPNAVKLMEDVVRQRGYRKSLMELTRRHKVGYSLLRDHLLGEHVAQQRLGHHADEKPHQQHRTDRRLDALHGQRENHATRTAQNLHHEAL